MVVLKLVEAEQGTSTFERPVHMTLTKVLPLSNCESRHFPINPAISHERTLLYENGADSISHKCFYSKFQIPVLARNLAVLKVYLSL
ncbi:hypothetical protein [Halobacillus sp. K22]|uniref:hypothetical protein n=1 Tax=Halobacillus sp. K22 TaxID=3457431 RepID=UPI003FCC7904